LPLNREIREERAREEGQEERRPQEL